MNISDKKNIDHIKFFCLRLAQLRTERKVSARQMSLDLGLNESYINHIENAQTTPSMNIFFLICNYLDVTPSAFFDTADINLRYSSELHSAIDKLSAKKQNLLLDFLKEWN